MRLYENIGKKHSESRMVNHTLIHIDDLKESDDLASISLTTSTNDREADYWDLISGDPIYGLWVSSDSFYGFSGLNEFGNIELVWGGVAMAIRSEMATLGSPTVHTITNEIDKRYINLNGRMVSFSRDEKWVNITAGFETQADYMEWRLKQ